VCPERLHQHVPTIEGYTREPCSLGRVPTHRHADSSGRLTHGTHDTQTFAPLGGDMTSALAPGTAIDRYCRAIPL
jgi:hypothetical protein